MDKERMEELAGNPRFISGIYNYCDRWCERCAFTFHCMNYALAQEEEAGAARSRDIENQAFWDKLDEVFETTKELIEEEAEEMDFDLDEEELQESIRQEDEVRDMAKSQPYSRIAKKYIDVVDQWFQLNEGLLGDKGDDLEPVTQADVPGVEAGAEGTRLRDCLEVIRWYQPQIWVKLCRAASGTLRAERDDLECFQEDADGSAKVALIGIERSIAAWATLRCRFPDHEDAIFAMGTLKRLLRQVEAAFPDARAFRRPGFDTDSPS